MFHGDGLVAFRAHAGSGCSGGIGISAGIQRGFIDLTVAVRHRGRAGAPSSTLGNDQFVVEPLRQTSTDHRLHVGRLRDLLCKVFARR
jgi:hypothetical protein